MFNGVLGVFTFSLFWSSGKIGLFVWILIKTLSAQTIVSCDTTFDQAFSGISPFAVTCPDNCLFASNAAVYGNVVYAGTSSLCRSGIHGDWINSENLTVTVQTTSPPLASYVGSFGGGSILSQALLSANTSAFRFRADVNECTNSTLNNCHQNATCTKRPGTFFCNCNPGFGGDGITCREMKECSTNSCPPFHKCVHSFGGFSCVCLTCGSFKFKSSLIMNISMLLVGFFFICFWTA